MDAKTLYQALDNIGKRHMPDTLDVLQGVQQQMMQRKQRYPSSRWYQQPSKLVASVLACVLLMVTAVYAVTRWSIHDPALHEDMATKIGLSQTIDDITVHLEWAYADANRITLSYSIINEAGELQREQVMRVILTDAQGHRYQLIRTFYADFDVPDILTGNAHFDASVIADYPQSLDLQFRVLDQFIFDFTVPFIPGVRIEKQPDVYVNGIHISLEWAIITPSMTRIYFCYESPIDELWTPNLQLAFDGRRVAQEAELHYPEFAMTLRGDDGRRCQNHFFLANYEEPPREITLTITHLQSHCLYSEESLHRAIEVLAGHDINAIIIRNYALAKDCQWLSIPTRPDDPALMERAWADVVQHIGDPTPDEIVGPWIFTIELP